MKFYMIAVAAGLATAPLGVAPVLGQDNPSAKDMKGPPNANGYGKEKMGETTTNDASQADGKNMKGPPNANGYQKQ